MFVHAVRRARLRCSNTHVRIHRRAILLRINPGTMLAYAWRGSNCIGDIDTQRRLQRIASFRSVRVCGRCVRAAATLCYAAAAVLLSHNLSFVYLYSITRRLRVQTLSHSHSHGVHQTAAESLTDNRSCGRSSWARPQEMTSCIAHRVCGCGKTCTHV